jgi:hypothetical protein
MDSEEMAVMRASDGVEWHMREAWRELMLADEELT